MTAPVEKTSKRVDWFTPERVLGPVRAYFKLRPGSGTIDLDPATSPRNPLDAWRFGTDPQEGLPLGWVKEEGNIHIGDGLTRPWHWDDLSSVNVFVNPPYGRALKDWCARIAANAHHPMVRIIALLPANRDETGYLQEHILDSPHLAAEVRIRKRLAFRDEEGSALNGGSNPYGSRLYVFDRGHNVWGHVCQTLAPLGIALRMTDRCRG